MNFLKIGDSWLWTAVVYSTGIILVSVFLYYREPIRKFAGEVSAELAKCSWPWEPEQKGLRKYKVLIDSTLVVVVVALLLSAYVTIFDILIKNLVNFLVKF